MIRKYGRFYELKTKAAEKLRGKRPLEEELASAVNEISYMNQNDVPEYQWDEVQSILKSCKTHEANGKEGIFRASINKMSYNEKLALKNAIETL